MKQKLLSLLVLLMTAVTGAWADIVDSGYCGDPSVNDGKDVSWTLTDAGVLTITKVGGTGAMEDYSGCGPWGTDITSVVIEDGVTTIGDKAFFNCTKLTSVSIPASVTSIGCAAFIYCGAAFALTDTPTVVTFADRSSLTTIGREAFSLVNLKSITLPASVTSIDSHAFNSCGNMETMTLNSNPSIAADAFCNISPTVTMNLTGHEGKTGEYWMTFYNQTFGFTADTNTKIYKAAVNGTSTAVVLTEVDDIPADNAAVLKSSNATITMTLATSTSGDYSGNELVGAYEAMDAPANTYCLSKETTGSARGVGFYTFTGTIPVNCAYLVVDGGPTTARGFLGFDDDDDTMGIGLPEATVVGGEGPVYDLSGRLVTGQPQKGIYVKNGKKVVIK